MIFPRVIEYLSHRPFRLNIIISLCVLFLHSSYGLIFGPTFSPDSHRYVDWSILLLESDFAIQPLLDNPNFYLSPIQYLSFVYLISGLMSVFGDSWSNALVLINGCASAMTMLLVLESIRKCCKSVVPILVVGLIYLASVDIMIWNKFILTDIIFLLIVSALIWCLSDLVDHRTGSWDLVSFRLLISALLICTALVTRPTAIPVAGAAVILLVAFLVLSFLKKGLSSSDMRAFATLGGFASLIIVISVVSLFFIRNDIVLFSSFQGVLDYYEAFLIEGAIVHDRQETYIDSNKTITAYLKVIGLRMCYFFSPIVTGYGTFHIIVNLIVFLPTYLFAVYSFNCLREEFQLSKRFLWTVLICMFFVFSIALFTSLTLLDYDFRYRLPALPGLLILCGLGIDMFIARRV